MLRGIKTIFKDGFKVNIVRTDRGMEFCSKEVNAYLKSVKVHHFNALNSETKHNAERLIETLKHKVFRYMMKNRTQRYVDVLQDIVHSYNNTVVSEQHRHPSPRKRRRKPTSTVPLKMSQD